MACFPGKAGRVKGGVEVGGVALALALALVLALMQVEAKRAHRFLTPFFLCLSMEASFLFLV